MLLIPTDGGVSMRQTLDRALAHRITCQNDRRVPFVGQVEPYPRGPGVRQLPLVARVEGREAEEAVVTHEDGRALHAEEQRAVVAAGHDETRGGGDDLRGRPLMRTRDGTVIDTRDGTVIDAHEGWDSD